MCWAAIAPLPSESSASNASALVSSNSIFLRPAHVAPSPSESADSVSLAETCREISIGTGCPFDQIFGARPTGVFSATEGEPTPSGAVNGGENGRGATPVGGVDAVDTGAAALFEKFVA